MKMAEIVSRKVNEFFGGEKGHTLCYEAYKYRNTKLLCRFGYYFINLCCFWEKDHCRKIYLIEKQSELTKKY